MEESAASEVRSAARNSAISFTGSAFSAAMGFVLVFVLAHALGTSGSGVVLQAIGVFTVALGVARLGLDTALVWLLPRLQISHPDAVLRVIIASAVPVAVAGCVLGVVLATGGEWFGLDTKVAAAVSVLAYFIPFGAVFLVLLAGTRGLGEIKAYVWLGSIFVPLVRPLGVMVTAALGLSTVAAVIAWAVPLPIALIAAVLVLRCQLRVTRTASAAAPSGTLRPMRSLYGFAAPRAVSTGLEQIIIWIDVLMVGVIAGSAAAGIYGSASRFVAAGLIIDTALRVVVAPRFSSLLHETRLVEVQALFVTVSTWLLLFSAPIYLILGIFASTVLGWLGPGFSSGAVALTILCVGMTVTLGAGNIHSLLLMSGHSGWAAFNKLVVVVINIGGNLVMIPWWGMEGAATVWAVSMLADAVLAGVQVRRFIGTRIQILQMAYVLMVTVGTVGIPALLTRLVLGQSTWTLLMAVVMGLGLLTLWSFRDRDRLHLDNLGLLRRSGHRGKETAP